MYTPGSAVSIFFMLCSSESITDFSLRNGLQMFAIGTFSIAGGRRKKRVTVDPAIPLGDLFRRGDLDGLTLFDHAHKIRCVDQTVHRTGV